VSLIFWKRVEMERGIMPGSFSFPSIDQVLLITKEQKAEEEKRKQGKNEFDKKEERGRGEVLPASRLSICQYTNVVPIQKRSD
jgi:hypothetical protein